MPGSSVPLSVKSEEQSLVTVTVTSPPAIMKKVKMEGSSGMGGPSSVSTSGSPEMAANKMNGNFTTPDAIHRLASHNHAHAHTHTHAHAHTNSHGSHNAQTENIGEGIVTPSSVINSKSNSASNNNKNAESGHQTSSAPASLTTSDGSKAALNPSAAAASASAGHFNNEAAPSGNVKTEPSSNAHSHSHAHAQSQSQSQSHSKPGTRSTTPVPTQSSSSSSKIKGSMLRTPLRSPKFNSGYTFNSDFPHFASPSIFLSPYVPSPPEALDKKMGNGGAEARHSGIMSSNFATDFGKNDLNDDTLNHVLPWLSPNAYGLFSPAGGLTASITPSAMKQPHTNFSLPLEGSSRNRVSNSGVGGAGGMMICVSPLARKNGTYGHSNAARMKQPETPINFHEVFASPKSDYNRGVNPYESALSNEIPSITESSKEAKMVLEKPLSERSVKEDEDLNVLLDLAKTTPRRNMDAEGREGTRVFRGAGGAFAYPAGQPVGPPSFLHLPMIGKNNSLKKAVGDQQAGKKTASSPKKRKTAAGQPPKTKLPLPGQMLHGPPQGYYPPPYMHPAASAAAAAAAAGRTSFPYSYPAPHGHAPAPYMYPKTALPAGASTVKGLKKKLGSKTPKPPTSTSSTAVKRPLPSAAAGTPPTKRVKKPSVKSTIINKGRGPGKKKPPIASPGADKQKSADAISAINTASGKKNDKAASLAAAVLRGVTMRPSGKWQAQLYFAGKSRYIGVFDSREKAALAYEIAREHLQNKASCNSKDTDGHVNAARKAAFEGVNEKDPRNES
jgi:hypothetical protein